MDARTENAAVPLAVDLDGTLIATDLLWEGLFLLNRKNPLFVFLVPLWLARGGQARLKCEIAERINEYDLEIIFYRPLNKNLEFAQPNKFFESIQGRLGIVVAEGKTMAPIVREWENGVVVSGFEGADLADALASLTAEDVAAMKEASDRAAREFNAEAEGRRFLTVISGERSIR